MGIPGTVIVYCRTDAVKAKADISMETKAHKPASHMRKVLENYSSLVRNYDVFMWNADREGHKVVIYDWRKQEPSWVFEQVEREVARCAE